MSKFTTEVRFICESIYHNYAPEEAFESHGFNDIDSILETVNGDIFNFEYPIFDDEYKNPLQIKILRYFYTREICEESVGLWKLRLQNKLNEIMPYYNKMYESELLSFQPLNDVDLTIKRDSTVDGENTSQGTSEGTSDNTYASWDKYSDTPQGGISGMTTSGAGTDMYLTNARNVSGSDHNETSASREASGTITTTEDYLERITGKRNGNSFARQLKEYRETFLNIDMMILHDLEPLFFGLWE